MPSSTAIRLAAFYAAFFTVIGTVQPFWPLWLAGKHLDAAEIGIVLATGIAVKVVGLPVAAHFADRSGRRRQPMLVLALLSTLFFALFAATETFWPILLISLLFFALWPPVMSLGESVAVMATRRCGLQYGRIRLWGSLAFIAAALGGGALLSRVSTAAIFWMILGGVTLTALSCLAVPDLRAEPSRSSRLPVAETLQQPQFLRMLVACGLIQGSHAVYYAFGTLHWQAAGFSKALIGALWAEAVLCEVVLFAYGAAVVRRIGCTALITLSGLAGALRWIGTGLTDDPAMLVGLQALHAASFGAAHLGAMHWIGHHVDARLSASAQSLYSAIVFGLFLGALLWAAGWLYGSVGAAAFLPMAGIALAGAGMAWPLSPVALDDRGASPAASP